MIKLRWMGTPDELIWFRRHLEEDKNLRLENVSRILPIRTSNRHFRMMGEVCMIQPKGSTMTWLCGLYRIEEGLPHFVILTREPGNEIRFIHDRMPLIMPKNMINVWIRPDVKPEGMLGATLTEMVYEKAI
ncbi:MAG: SOS response-associated peptidase family protein [Eubacteriales bacterium]|nr:SOS response-associated peptidase family protein [Eubacteriales bacterium]